MGVLGGHAQFLGVAEPGRLGPQGRILARLGLHALDLCQADAQELRLLLAFPRGRHDLGEPALHVPQPLPGRPVGGERLGHVGAGEPVQRLALPGGRAQPDLVALAVHGDEVLGDLGEDADGHGPAAQVSAAAGLRADGARDDEDVAVVELRARLDRALRRGPCGSTSTRPSTVAVPWPFRTLAGSALPPMSSPRPVTTMVLPAPVSPVTTVRPGPSSRTASAITPSPRRRISSSTRPPSAVRALPAGAARKD